MRERNNGSMYQKTSCDTSRERERKESKNSTTAIIIRN